MFIPSYLLISLTSNLFIFLSPYPSIFLSSYLTHFHFLLIISLIIFIFEIFKKLRDKKWVMIFALSLQYLWYKNIEDFTFL